MSVERSHYCNHRIRLRKHFINVAGYQGVDSGRCRKSWVCSRNTLLWNTFAIMIKYLIWYIFDYVFLSYKWPVLSAFILLYTFLSPFHFFFFTFSFARKHKSTLESPGNVFVHLIWVCVTSFWLSIIAFFKSAMWFLLRSVIVFYGEVFVDGISSVVTLTLLGFWMCIWAILISRLWLFFLFWVFFCC